MFITKVRLKSVKCFSDLAIEFPAPEGGKAGGWYVIVGPNGLGKSTVLRAMALVLGGCPDPSWVADVYPWAGAPDGADLVRLDVVVPRLLQDESGREYRATELALTVPPTSTSRSVARGEFGRIRSQAEPLLAGYGAFRRVGGRRASAPAFRGDAAAFVSLFDDDAPLDATQWLLEAESRSRAGDDWAQRSHAQLCETVVSLVNDTQLGLLPPGFVMLPLSPDGVRFRDPLGHSCDVAALGDGYRSILGLVLSLVKQAVRWKAPDEADAFGSLATPQADVRAAAQRAGVVLIDEPDAHLHPEWQREIGFALQRVFPNIQFIVATHSPFICQAASPGGIIQLRLNEEEKRIEAVRPVPETVRGWYVDEIYDRAIGVPKTLDIPTQQLRDQYVELEAARLQGTLTATQRKKLRKVEAELDATMGAPGRTREEREQHARLQELTKQLAADLEGR